MKDSLQCTLRHYAVISYFLSFPSIAKFVDSKLRAGNKVNQNKEKNAHVLLFINYLTPKSNQHLISPYNISPESNIKVARI